MKVLVSWLRELVDVSASADDLGQRLHLAGFELAGIERVAPHSLSPGGERGSEQDAVIDLEISANRPDCLSMAGIAREVATLYDRPLKYAPAAFPSAGDPSTAGPLRVTIEAPDLCPRYTAALADVTVGPSPAWLVDRLSAAGIRSINNIVDVTNYVLLETGHPLHAFDLARLAGPHLRIRRAAAGETVKTLDGQTRTLAPDMLVIADADRAQAVAGVMGGSESEVSAATATIALESVYFHPPSVRRTSKRLGLSTEASYRFERGADPEAPSSALARACALVEEIGAGRVRPGWIDARPAPPTAKTLVLRHSRIARVLGFAVAAPDVERILKTLGFELSRRPSSPSAGPEPGARSPEPDLIWHTSVPSWRIDVLREIDLVEEVARIAGYDRIPTTFPALTVAPPPPDLRLRRDAQLRGIARGLGFSESVTFSFIDREEALGFADAGGLVPIANPLSENFAVMRPSLLPGLVGSVAHNRRREQRHVRLFELANRFTRERGEHRALGLAWTGDASAGHWSGSTREVDAFDLSGAVSALCRAIGLDATLSPAPVAYLSDATASRIEVRPCGGSQSPRHVGVLGQLVPSIADRAGLPAREPVYVAEIDLDAVVEWTELGDRVRATALPRFPSSVRDLSIVVPIGLPAADIRGTIREASPATLERVQEFDRYQGRGVPEGHCSLSLRLTFRASDRTLTDAEVQAAVDAVVGALAARHGATLR